MRIKEGSSMTKVQEKFYDKLVKLTIKEQRIFNLRELADIEGVTVKAIADRVNSMARKGFVKLQNGKAGIYPKTIRLVEIYENE